ncbi:MAG TPA: hypothetical protein DCE41_36540 [Cytophagales bacterium]|nr:hypothetical protein [Cytophagales bacterium]HAA18362.1 hypothetical protein [Cytophagales bacterium]HAP60346.1 hypothetical protein [Cytophagales bacterium]
MKKALLSVLAMAAIIIPSYGQVPVSEVFQVGDILVSAGVGIPSRYSTPLGASESVSIPTIIHAEFGIQEWFSVGPVIGLTAFPVTVQNVDYSSQIIHLGARASFHATSLIDEATDGEFGLDGIDVYGVFMPGLVLFNVINNDTDPRVLPALRARVGLGAGVRYYLTPSIGVFVEGVAGFQSFATGGVTFKFKR